MSESEKKKRRRRGRRKILPAEEFLNTASSTTIWASRPKIK
jgi:hypothetical protein